MQERQLPAGRLGLEIDKDIFHERVRSFCYLGDVLDEAGGREEGRKERSCEKVRLPFSKPFRPAPLFRFMVLQGLRLIFRGQFGQMDMTSICKMNLRRIAILTWCAAC